MAKDYYRILGLTSNAEDVVIRAVFKQLAHRYHPDKWLEEKDLANRMMSEINEAYQHLSDPSLRAKNGQTFETSLDFYRILGVQSYVDAQIINIAYQALVKKYRGSPKKLDEINQAYKVLSDTGKRKMYDFRQKSPILRSGYHSGLSLWKVYLAYNIGFYILMTAIFMLVLFYKH
ncbi:MAG: DnaJ domain-containing protein [Methylobacter sp.]|nr:DnaJ domain-containing protein [Methylobacter sp.]